MRLIVEFRRDSHRNSSIKFYEFFSRQGQANPLELAKTEVRGDTRRGCPFKNI
jgi:hypothetical protein